MRIRARPVYLRRHQALHTSRSQSNVCQGCGKTFSRLDALNVSLLSSSAYLRAATDPVSSHRGIVRSQTKSENHDPRLTFELLLLVTYSAFRRRRGLPPGDGGRAGRKPTKPGRRVGEREQFDRAFRPRGFAPVSATERDKLILRCHALRHFQSIPGVQPHPYAYHPSSSAPSARTIVLLISPPAQVPFPRLSAQPLKWLGSSNRVNKPRLGRVKTMSAQDAGVNVWPTGWGMLWGSSGVGCVGQAVWMRHPDSTSLLCGRSAVSPCYELLGSASLHRSRSRSQHAMP